MTPRRFLAASVLSLATLLALPAFAEGPSSDQPSPDRQTAERRPGQVARDHVDEVLRSLEKFVAGLPRYGLPEVRENGDIVIPRLVPDGPAAPGGRSLPLDGEHYDL